MQSTQQQRPLMSVDVGEAQAGSQGAGVWVPDRGCGGSRPHIVAML